MEVIIRDKKYPQINTPLIDWETVLAFINVIIISQIGCNYFECACLDSFSEWFNYFDSYGFIHKKELIYCLILLQI